MSLNRRRSFHRSWRPRRAPSFRRQSRSTWHQGRTERVINFGSPKSIALTIFFGGCLVWFTYFFLYSQHLSIRTVNITGLESIPVEEFNNIVENYLKARRSWVVPNRSLVAFSKARFRNVISQKYILDNINIDRDWPWTLNITVKEKQARLVLRTVAKVEIAQAAETVPNTASIAGETVDGTQEAAPAEPTFTLVTSYYYLDVNGIVVAEKDNIPEAELQNLPVVEVASDSQTRVKPGDVVLDRDLVGYMFAVYEALAKSSANIKITNLIYEPKVVDELKFLTDEGWQGFLSRKLALDTQMRKLELALEEKIKDKRGTTLQYVDLRVKDRVYFK